MMDKIDKDQRKPFEKFESVLRKILSVKREDIREDKPARKQKPNAEQQPQRA